MAHMESSHAQVNSTKGATDFHRIGKTHETFTHSIHALQLKHCL